MYGIICLLYLLLPIYIHRYLDIYIRIFPRDKSCVQYMVHSYDSKALNDDDDDSEVSLALNVIKIK